MANKIALPVIWQIPDDLWQIIEPIVRPSKQPGTTGRPPLDPRAVLDGILHVLRTGCQWNAVPGCFGSSTSIHRYFQGWSRQGRFNLIWQVLTEYYDKLVGICWRWLAADCALVKAVLGGTSTGKSPVDRGKLATKRTLLTDKRGAPLALTVNSGNRTDMRLLDGVLSSLVVDRPAVVKYRPQHLCLDKGFDYQEVDELLIELNFRRHIARKKKGSSPLAPPPRSQKTIYRAKRWVVERTHAWYNRFKKIAVRSEKSWRNYQGLCDFASALIIYRMIHRLSRRKHPLRLLG